jgi:hypothetical protein
MDALLTVLHLVAWIALGLAVAVPAVRRAAVGALLLAAIAGVVAGLLSPEPRRLETLHTYAGFEGMAFEVSMVSFPTGSFEAPGWQWPLPFAAFAVVWCAVLLALRRRLPANPLLLPLLLAWSATATWLAMQWLAAPSATVQPVGLDRFLWPAGLAAALLAARAATTFVQLFVLVAAATMLARLPAALFSKYASDARLGTVLDVHTIRDIVNPMTQMQFEPRLALDSGQQQFWLIWLQHVIVFPAIHLLSLLGIAFGAWMVHRHPDSARDAGAGRAH